MSDGIDVLANVAVTPELVAQMFWGLGDDQQADFFAALERMAGVKLCFQMAGVVNVIRARCEAGDYDALNGFQTMLSHAQGYADSAAHYRASNAKAAVSAIAAAPKLAGEGND